MPFTKERITFESNGVRCAGYLYLPTPLARKVPAVILANGFTGTMDWILPRYAERFAEAGFAALIFDYRYFGESEGHTRQLVDVAAQRDDIRSAIAYIRARDSIDSHRIALWGTSLGGGNVLYVAAEDSNIAAVVAQVPGFDLVSPQARATIKVPITVVIKLLASAVWDAIRGLFGMSPYYLPVWGAPGEAAVFTDPNLKPNFEALMKNSKHWRNKFTPRFYLALPRYKKGTAEKLTMPLLVCVARRDEYANPVFQAWVGKQAPKGQVIEYDADHFDFYHGMQEQVIRDQVEFLTEHLLPS